jgi:hypothetical protein
VPREGLLALFLAIGCAVPRTASDPSPSPVPAPTPVPVVEVIPPVPVDPCAGVVAFDERNPPQAPKRRSCKVTSEGECPYRDPSHPLPPSPYDEEALDELRAHDVYARCGDDPDRVRDARYMRLQIRAEHRDLADETASIEAFIEEYDGHPLAGWAAFLLIDELTVRATEREVRSVGDFEAIVGWIERLETMALWKLESAEDLQHMTPILHAGASWQLALEARDRGRYGECADRFLAISKQYIDHDRASEQLALASDCLEADLRIDEANELRRQLKQRFPHSEHVER